MPDFSLIPTSEYLPQGTLIRAHRAPNLDEVFVHCHDCHLTWQYLGDRKYTEPGDFYFQHTQTSQHRDRTTYDYLKCPCWDFPSFTMPKEV